MLGEIVSGALLAGTTALAPHPEHVSVAEAQLTRTQRLLDDARALRAKGVQAVFTPKDVDMNAIMTDMVNIIRRDHGLAALA